MVSRSLACKEDSLPNLESISARLAPRTGWSSTPVSGFLPAPAFFEMLATRCFPTTTWLRSRNSLEYTPEPDIFHDVFGHVPMHSHPVFADFLEHYGRVVCVDIRFSSSGKVWPSVLVYGRVRSDPATGAIKVYGSGLISSHRECRNVVDGHCAIREFSLDEVLATPVKVDELHTLLFAVSCFDQIYEAMHEAERRAMLAAVNRLVARGAMHGRRNPVSIRLWQ